MFVAQLISATCYSFFPLLETQTMRRHDSLFDGHSRSTKDALWTSQAINAFGLYICLLHLGMGFLALALVPQRHTD